MQQRILDGELFGKAKTKTFAQGCVSYWRAGGREKYATIGFDPKTEQVSKLLAWFYDTPMSEIDREAVEAYADAHHPTAKASTVNRMVIAPIKAVLTHNDVPNAHIKKWSEQRVESAHASPELFKATLEACADLPHLRAALLTMTATGRRVGEIVSWERHYLNWENGHVTMPRTKNGEGFTVKLPDFVLEEIRALPDFRNGRVFGYVSRYSLYGALKRRCAKAGIPYLGTHKLGRHTFATWALTHGGMSLKEVQMAGGWKSLTALQRYLHVTPSQAQERATQLFDKVPGLSEKLSR